MHERGPTPWNIAYLKRNGGKGYFHYDYDHRDVKKWPEYREAWQDAGYLVRLEVCPNPHDHARCYYENSSCPSNVYYKDCGCQCRKCRGSDYCLEVIDTPYRGVSMHVPPLVWREKRRKAKLKLDKIEEHLLAGKDLPLTVRYGDGEDERIKAEMVAQIMTRQGYRAHRHRYKGRKELGCYRQHEYMVSGLEYLSDGDGCLCADCRPTHWYVDIYAPDFDDE